MPSQIACQLYTLRDFTKTPADIAATLARVKKIGYDAVQCSGLGPIAPRDLKKILDDNALTCCVTHVPLDKLKADPQQVIDDHRILDCPLTAIGGLFLPKDQPWSLQTWLDFLGTFNPLADRLAAAGLQLGYHNHSHELARFGNTTALELLWKQFSKNVWMEIDTYWIAHGGADPAAWIHKVAGRIPAVHLKDMGITPTREQFMAEVGEGNLNWPAVLSACKSAGVKWYIIEQDICQRDPFESIAISLRNLKAMGIA